MLYENNNSMLECRYYILYQQDMINAEIKLDIAKIQSASLVIPPPPLTSSSDLLEAVLTAI